MNRRERMILEATKAHDLCFTCTVATGLGVRTPAEREVTEVDEFNIAPVGAKVCETCADNFQLITKGL